MSIPVWNDEPPRRQFVDRRGTRALRAAGRTARSARDRASRQPRPSVVAALDVFAHTAGDVDRCARDVARAVAEQKRDETRDLVGQPETTEWHLPGGKAAEELLACQLRGSPPVDVLPLRRDHKADVDTVDE